MSDPQPAMIQVMEARASVALALSAPAERTSDVERFEAIYREHFGSVDAYARRRLPSRADDIVAETFLVTWRRLEHVPEDALPWLYGVARRVLSDCRRSSSRQDAVAERLARVVRQDAAEAKERDEDLLAALALLPERDRELLLLLHWEDLEPRRIARALGCSRASVATRLWRAHRRLRSEVERMRGDL